MRPLSRHRHLLRHRPLLRLPLLYVVLALAPVSIAWATHGLRRGS